MQQHDSMTFHPVDLFGGAITAELPTTFADVSNIRQVPDHQEVYLDSQGFSSVIVEILERLDKPDLDAVRHHLEDLVEVDISAVKIITTEEVSFSKLSPDAPAYTVLAIVPPGEKQIGRDNEPDFVAVFMTLLRLQREKTDLLVLVNVPFVKDQYDRSLVDIEAGQLGPLGATAHEMRRKIYQTFDIKDFSLFGAE